MPRFFISRADVGNGKITVGGEDAKHITLSLRARPGEVFTLCDCEGTDYICEFCEADKNTAVFEIKEAVKNQSEPTVDVTLFMSLVKADKFEDVVQKSVEMGVKTVVPVITKRCVSRPDEKSLKSKLERWNKIAKEAAGQSGRGCVPTVIDAVDFKNAVSMMKQTDSGFVCYENERATDLNGAMEPAIQKGAKSYCFLIGPEGGFEPEEIAYAQSEGIGTVSLGKRILRAQTAPVCVLSAIMYATGNMG